MVRQCRKVSHINALLRLQHFRVANLTPFELGLGAGECISLGGPSGSGKTRLLRAVADLDPHEGECVLEGRARTGMSGPDWRRAVTLLLAESGWWADRVDGHFPAGRPSPAELEALGLPAESRGWPVARLSSGERQRLALLRALAIEPRVLLLDEPTANLDETTVLRVEALVAGWLESAGGACIWSSHDPEQRRRVATRHLRIEGGSVMESSEA